jgi:hypothetical protein
MLNEDRLCLRVMDLYYTLGGAEKYNPEFEKCHQKSKDQDVEGSNQFLSRKTIDQFFDLNSKKELFNFFGIILM